MPSGHKSITDIELLNPGVQIVHKDDKSPRLDIRARSEDGTIHHIELVWKSVFSTTTADWSPISFKVVRTI